MAPACLGTVHVAAPGVATAGAASWGEIMPPPWPAPECSVLPRASFGNLHQDAQFYYGRAPASS